MMTRGPTVAVAVAVAAAVAVAVSCTRKAREAAKAPAVDGGPVAAAARIPGPRLPAFAVPLGYDLSLSVDPALPRFSGVATISLRLARPSAVLWLHGKDLAVRQATLRAPGGTTLAGRYRQRNDDGVASVTFPRAAPAGAATLTIAYDAPFDRSGVGLYRVDDGGEAYAFTQFEAVDARRCFPGFDEPNYKTPFRLTLTVRGTHVAVANTRAEKEERLPDGRKRIRFARSLPLPTYLVALAVGPLEIVEAPPVPAKGVRRAPLPLRGVAVRGKGGTLVTALRMAPGILHTLETYFGIPYPYDKLDLIAVPGATLAMENAGAITFGERFLLMRPDTTTVRQHRRAAVIIAHEMSHQWFGDLVTMRWWDDLWLNESFATWRSFPTVDRWRPHMNAWTRSRKETISGTRLDRLVSARRIRQPIATIHDIDAAFDDITYGKGAQVLKMLERYLGPESFRRGIRRHLTRFRFGSASLDDFLASLSRESGKAIAGPARSFLVQPGLPLLRVRPRCEGDKGVLDVAQSRYLPLGSKGDPRRLWQVPLCVRYGVSGQVREHCHLLAKASERIRLPGKGCPTWVFPNADAAGYYRFTLLPGDLRRLLANAARLSFPEQAALADNLVSEFEAGRLGFGETLEALAPFCASANRGVAASPMALLRRMRAHVVPPGLKGRFDAYTRNLYAGTRARLGWDRGRDPEARAFRREVLSFLALDARDPAIRREAAARATAYLSGSSPARLAPDLVEVALSVAVADGGPRVFDAVAARLRASTDTALRVRYVRALAHAPNSERPLALLLDPALTLDEVAKLLEALGETTESREALWRWMPAHFDRLVPRLSPTAFGAGELPRRFEGFCTPSRTAALGKFFAPRVDRLPGAPQSLASARETITLCAALRAAQRENARRFLSAVDGASGRQGPAP